MLEGRVATLAQPEELATDLETLREQLAELEVAYTELEEQNDELQARSWSANAIATSCCSTRLRSDTW